MEDVFPFGLECWGCRVRGLTGLGKANRRAHQQSFVRPEAKASGYLGAAQGIELWRPEHGERCL
jgi:hypothetical protein